MVIKALMWLPILWLISPAPFWAFAHYGTETGAEPSMHDTYFVVPNPEFSFLILATPILFAVVFAMIEMKIRLGYWLRAAQLQLGLYLLSLICFLILPNHLLQSGDMELIATIETIGAWALALSFIFFALIVANIGHRYRKDRNG